MRSAIRVCLFHLVQPFFLVAVVAAVRPPSATAAIFATPLSSHPSINRFVQRCLVLLMIALEQVVLRSVQALRWS